MNHFIGGVTAAFLLMLSLGKVGLSQESKTTSAKATPIKMGR
ncbi:hypothetical protein OAK81_00475 [Verrucomicrobiales bacterium]|nr:hypothetical protein [Verrucomicrobiales bacterium]MDC0322632.1 hypothetical protein [Verrucomicrobiales bacterium]